MSKGAGEQLAGGAVLPKREAFRGHDELSGHSKQSKKAATRLLVIFSGHFIPHGIFCGRMGPRTGD